LNSPLPIAFIENITAVFGTTFSEALCACLDQGKGDRSIRLNTHKVQHALSLPAVPWCASGFLVKNENTFAYDPAFHAGLYYVQEAASMFVDHVLKHLSFEQQTPLLCLDLCAAPGGKSTILSTWLGKRGTLVSNEIIASRAEILKENIIKWGLGNTIVTNNEPAQFAKVGEVFDLILIDAPCSGEGLFRRDPAARQEWSAKQVAVNVERQHSILEHAWHGLKEGGYLIYSTCTFNTEENEEQVTFMQNAWGAEVIDIPIDQSWNIYQHETNGNYRFFPHRTAGEGFALVVLRKTARSNEGKARYRSKARSPIQLERKFPLSSYIDTDTSETQCFSANEHLMALNAQQVEVCQGILNGLHIKYAGIDIGTLKQKDFIPAQALAHSIYLRKESFLHYESTYQEALTFLMRENFIPSNENRKGLNLIHFQNTPLGFMKFISPSRTNNYYPQEWRIRQAADHNTMEKFGLASVQK
jgi:16S rRNA C967 or C1407 C5-methylase (RsmB/RsmF family)/NOL1/NOP2/fmu family ribosome biogenesis protein